jgi:hypothetical protein
MCKRSPARITLFGVDLARFRGTVFVCLSFLADPMSRESGDPCGQLLNFCA